MVYKTNLSFLLGVGFKPNIANKLASIVTTYTSDLKKTILKALVLEYCRENEIEMPTEETEEQPTPEDIKEAEDLNKLEVEPEIPSFKNLYRP